MPRLGEGEAGAGFRPAVLCPAARGSDGIGFPAADCHRNGVLIEIGGHYSNVARFLPPLVLSESLAKRGIEIFADAVGKVESTL